MALIESHKFEIEPDLVVMVGPGLESKLPQTLIQGSKRKSSHLPILFILLLQVP